MDPQLLHYLGIAVSGILIGCVYALIATGLTLVFGVLRLVNIAHGEMVVIGMYAGWMCWTHLGLPTAASVCVSAALLFCAGYLLQRFLVNRVIARPIHIQFLFYIGLALIITGLQAMVFGVNGLSIQSPAQFDVYEVGPLRLDAIKTDAALGAILLMLLLWVFLRTSTLGKSIRGCAENGLAARIVGIRVTHVFAVTAGIGAACAGAAGGLIAPLFETNPYLGAEFTLLSFIVVVLGGLGSLGGALAGGIMIGLVEALAASLVQPSMKSLFSIGVLVLILLLRPYGLLGKRGVS